MPPNIEPWVIHLKLKNRAFAQPENNTFDIREDITFSNDVNNGWLYIFAEMLETHQVYWISEVFIDPVWQLNDYRLVDISRNYILTGNR